MRFRINQAHLTVAITAVVFVLLYVIASILYPGFFSYRVFVNFFKDNAFLGVIAVGMTFVILSGGIDLSVGSMVGFASILAATLIERQGMHPLAVIPLVLAIGAIFGAGMGSVIHFFDLAPFLVTLAGMFLARGVGYLISVESIPLYHPFFGGVGQFNIPLGVFTLSLPTTALIFLLVLAAGIYISSYTRFGRNVYALGGNEQSAILMGLPVGLTKIGVYTLSGFCSALGGVVYAFYTFSGNASAGVGLELDAIAAVVIGGTLLTGGVGHVSGTLIGVLILGIIQTAISFDGRLSSWWTKIAIGLLLFAFVVMQRFLSRGLKRAMA